MPQDGPPDDLPRRNGELVFDAPWESRAFGTAAAYLEARRLPWDAFRQQLMTAVRDAPPDTPYYESFVAALEALVVGDAMLRRDDIDARADPVHSSQE